LSLSIYRFKVKYSDRVLGLLVGKQSNMTDDHEDDTAKTRIS
jgi:hypothetical protein